MPLLRNDALKKNPILRSYPSNEQEWTRWIQTLDAQKVVEVGAIVLSEYIRLGQTAYDTGTGFWLGDDGGTPKLSIGNASGNKLIWNGSALSITGVVNMTNSVQTFTPSGWTGFSTDPTGDISYLDFGPFVMLWVNSALTGLSDEVFMSFSTGMPAAIRPSAQRDVRCVLLDENYVCGGVARVDPSGAMAFFLEEVNTGTPPPANTIGFNNIFTDPSAAGSKGLPSGWMVTYPK